MYTRTVSSTRQLLSPDLLDQLRGNAPELETLDIELRSEEETRAFASALENNIHLKSLSVCFGADIIDVRGIFDKQGRYNNRLKVLAAALSTNRYLKNLYLQNNAIDQDGARALCASLATNKTLEVLNLSDNCIGVEGLIAIFTLLQKPGNNLQLVFTKYNRIQSISLEDSEKIRTAINNIRAAAISHPSVLENPDDFLEGNLLSNDFIVADARYALQEAFERVRKHQTIAQETQQRFDTAQATTLRPELQTAITSIAQNRSVLLDINLYNADETKQFTAALKKNTSLKGLTILFGNPNDFTPRVAGEYDEQVELLCGTLTHSNVCLASLELADNAISHRGAKAIAIYLHNSRRVSPWVTERQYPQQLKTLNLASNELDGGDVSLIKKVLESDNTLESLNLSVNKIGPTGAEHIFGLLIKNHHLKYICIYENNITPNRLDQANDFSNFKIQLNNIKVLNHTLVTDPDFFMNGNQFSLDDSEQNYIRQTLDEIYHRNMSLAVFTQNASISTAAATQAVVPTSATTTRQAATSTTTATAQATTASTIVSQATSIFSRIVSVFSITGPTTTAANNLPKLTDADFRKIEEDCLQCPVTFELLKKPILLWPTSATTSRAGHTYSKETTDKFHAGRQRDPNTNNPFEEKVKNTLVKKIITCCKNQDTAGLDACLRCPITGEIMRVPAITQIAGRTHGEIVGNTYEYEAIKGHLSKKATGFFSKEATDFSSKKPILSPENPLAINQCVKNVIETYNALLKKAAENQAAITNQPTSNTAAAAATTNQPTPNAATTTNDNQPTSNATAIPNQPTSNLINNTATNHPTFSATPAVISSNNTNVDIDDELVRKLMSALDRSARAELEEISRDIETAITDDAKLYDIFAKFNSLSENGFNYASKFSFFKDFSIMRLGALERLASSKDDAILASIFSEIIRQTKASLQSSEPIQHTPHTVSASLYSSLGAGSYSLFNPHNTSPNRLHDQSTTISMTLPSNQPVITVHVGIGSTLFPQRNETTLQNKLVAAIILGQPHEAKRLIDAEGAVLTRPNSTGRYPLFAAVTAPNIGLTIYILGRLDEEDKKTQWSLFGSSVLEYLDTEYKYRQLMQYYDREQGRLPNHETILTLAKLEQMLVFVKSEMEKYGLSPTSSSSASPFRS